MLKDIVVPTEKIKVGKESFVVQGLTLNALGLLMKNNFEALSLMMEGTTELDTMAEQYPEFIAKVIAMAANEEDSWEHVQQLPGPLQLLIFEKVWDLTVPDYDALGKLIGRVKGLIPQLPESKDSK